MPRSVVAWQRHGTAWDEEGLGDGHVAPQFLGWREPIEAAVSQWIVFDTGIARWFAASVCLVTCTDDCTWNERGCKAVRQLFWLCGPWLLSRWPCHLSVSVFSCICLTYDIHSCRLHSACRITSASRHFGSSTILHSRGSSRVTLIHSAWESTTMIYNELLAKNSGLAA